MLFAGETRRGRAAQWYIWPTHPQSATLAERLPASPLVAQVLANRGLCDPSSASGFLNPQLDQLHDPALLPGCDAAAERILHAVRSGQRIVIYGDYDVDGMTALAILWHALALAGAKAEHYIPSRIEEGYGLNSEAVQYLVADPAGPRAELLITVDCGVSAHEPVALARRLGADVIVTDHHEFSTTHAGLPDAIVVHPRGPGSAYPNPNLCGAGVAFKLAWHLGRKLSNAQRVDPAFKDFLLTATSLAALGTIADVVELTGENRVLARFGLRALPQTRHVGLAEFIASCGFKQDRLNTYDVGFVLAPRLNAAGRIGDAALACELLLATTRERAREISALLATHNRARQQIEREVVRQARQMAIDLGLTADDVRAIVLAGDAWHRGVIGLAASRLTNEFNRPTVVISLSQDADAAAAEADEPGLGHGSCRSIEGFDLAAALGECGQHLVSFGGHPMAAGLKIRREHIESFRAAFQALAAKRLRREDLVKRLDIEGRVELAQITPASVDDLARLEPFGQGNPRPLFATELLELVGEPRVVGSRGTVLQFDLKQDRAVRRAVCFDGAAWHHDLCDARAARVVFEPSVNEFRGNRMAELVVKDVAFE